MRGSARPYFLFGCLAVTIASMSQGRNYDTSEGLMVGDTSGAQPKPPLKPGIHAPGVVERIKDPAHLNYQRQGQPKKERIQGPVNSKADGHGQSKEKKKRSNIGNGSENHKSKKWLKKPRSVSECNARSYEYDHGMYCNSDNDWYHLRYGCYKFFNKKKLDWENAFKACDSTYASLVEPHTVDRLGDVHAFLRTTGAKTADRNYWINAKQVNLGQNCYFRWNTSKIILPRDGKKSPKSAEWYKGQPNQCGTDIKKRACGHLFMAAEDQYFDQLCTHEMYYICIKPARNDKYLNSGPKCEVTPKTTWLKEGDPINFVCTGYDDFGVDVTYRNLSLNFTEDGASKYHNLGFFQFSRSCRTYYKNYTYERYKDGPCVRRTTLTVNLVMSSDLHKMTVKVCLYHECSRVAYFRLYVPPRIPIFTTMPPYDEGDTATVLCNSLVGSENITTLVMVVGEGTQQSVYNVWSINKNDKHVKHCPNLDCTVSLLVVDSNMTITVKFTVTKAHHGTKFFCYSYDAVLQTQSSNEDLISNYDPALTAESDQLLVKYKSEKPELTVIFPSKTSKDLHLEYPLEATCRAPVGNAESGQLKWTLTFDNGTIVDFPLEFPFNPENAPKHPGVSFHSIPRVPKPCNNSWHGDKYSTRCFKRFEGDDHAKTWLQARQSCKFMFKGADLLTISSEKSNQIVKKELNRDGYWIGLSDTMTNDHEFHWLEDVSNEVEFFNFEDMHDPYERKGDQCCVISGTNGKWHRHGCSYKLHYICQTRPGEYINDSVYSKEMGSMVKSTILINSVDKSFDNATLKCSTTINGDTSEVQSSPFKTAWGPDKKPIMSRELKKIGPDNFVLHVGCAAHVGQQGEISWGIFYKRKIKFVYYITHTGQLIEAKPSPHIRITRISAFNNGKKGKFVSSYAEIKIRSEFLINNAVAKCFGYNISDFPKKASNDLSNTGYHVNEPIQYTQRSTEFEDSIFRDDDIALIQKLLVVLFLCLCVLAYVRYNPNKTGMIKKDKKPQPEDENPQADEQAENSQATKNSQSPTPEEPQLEEPSTDKSHSE